MRTPVPEAAAAHCRPFQSSLLAVAVAPGQYSGMTHGNALCRQHHGRRMYSAACVLHHAHEVWTACAWKLHQAHAWSCQPWVHRRLRVEAAFYSAQQPALPITVTVTATNGKLSALQVR